MWRGHSCPRVLLWPEFECSAGVAGTSRGYKSGEDAWRCDRSISPRAPKTYWTKTCWRMLAVRVLKALVQNRVKELRQVMQSVRLPATLANRTRPPLTKSAGIKRSRPSSRMDYSIPQRKKMAGANCSTPFYVSVTPTRCPSESSLRGQRFTTALNSHSPGLCLLTKKV